MVAPDSLPTFQTFPVKATPKLTPTHGLHLKNGEEGAIHIYYLEPTSAAAAANPALFAAVESGKCEILSVNGHRLRSPRRCLEMVDIYMKKRGACDILVSLGGRSRGTTYVMTKNVKDRSIFSEEASRDPSVIDELVLEQKKDSIRVLNDPSLTSGFFSKHPVRKGDYIWAIDGKEIRTIDDARKALMGAKGALIPILTYNSFRKLRTTVMADTTREIIKENKRVGAKASPVRIEQKYKIEEKLGEGAFAVVKKATNRQTGKVYAIKIVDRSNLDRNMEDALKDEIFILNELNHSHIMGLDDVIVTINNYFLVTEYLEGGELFDRIVDKNSYTESEARDCCRIVFDGLAYCHRKGVVHRDLKPENLLLQYKHSDSEIKIADFGFAKVAPAENSLTTICGTPGYVAPEILRKQKYGSKADMWSMGVIVFILIGGYPPFYAETERDIFRLTVAGKFSFDEAHWGHISPGAKDFISSMLTTNPSKRASAEEVLRHTWMNEDRFSLRRRSLMPNQAELKKHLARKRFKKAIHSIIFIQNFAGENAVFAGKDKHKSINV
mmetsp:Transcript_6064/g.11062  ORF Transcript_6064/g.11062 Transcript_6064/m.11062 type:complete len:554 (-) Transcript_6064:486-2147(-)